MRLALVLLAAGIALVLVIRAVADAHPHVYCVAYKDGQSECHMEVGRDRNFFTFTGAM